MKKPVIKTTVTLTEKELIEAIETGFFSSRKIISIDWVYKDVIADTGRGNATYERAVSGAVVEFNS